MKQINYHRLIASAVLTLWLGWSTIASAQLMNLSDVPLFLGFRSEPNIFFVIDDSGSMDWEVMTSDTSQDGRFTGLQRDGSNAGTGPVKHRDSDNNGTANCGFNDANFFGYIYGVEFSSNSYGDNGYDCNTADDQAWRFRNNAFNALYFDPHRIYSPWKGLNNNGDPFPQMSATNALANPYDPSSETINLLSHNSNWLGGTSRATSDRDGDSVSDGFFFYTWTDANGNGLFDNGEETEHQLNDLDPTFLASLEGTFGGGAPVTAAMVQTNFANWFSYHRSREFVAKAAYGEVIAGASDVRMGLSTLHDHNDVTTKIRSMNADPTTGNKKTLLDQLYSIHSANGTPLRKSLKEAGKYLDCETNNIDSTCPALAEADGGACQQNFAIVMTDGFYNGDSPGLGNTDGGTSNSAFDGGAYADNESNTLADVAMHYYERDLHSNLDDHVPITPGIDEARHQHMVTYTVAFGVNGSLTSMPPNDTDPFTGWPTSSFNRSDKIDDLRHAAYNGRGEFLNASRPEELVEALNDALSSIADRVSSAASVALNSGSHNADSRIYQARFNSGDWSGQLLAYPIDEEGNVLPAAWDAGEVLDSKNWDTERNIITYNNTSNLGIEFRWNKLSQEMKDLLNLDADGNPDANGEKRLEYLRGSKEYESQLFRVRLHTLGDLIHSDPFFVGVPDNHDAIGEDYSDFREDFKDRSPMVYVGGNDGMLHGFNALNGEEEFAYVPRYAFTQLSQLTNPIYQHQYFIDGAPTVGDAYGNFSYSRCAPDSSCWRSILLGGMRKGGQAIFALDVTNPALFQESSAAQLALWEFSDQDDADLGYTFGQVSIVKMANDRWAAVVGNGYNNTEDDTARGGAISTTGHASLFIIFIDGGLDGTWTLGQDYIKIDTGVGELATPNGLSAPSPVDIDGDFKVDYVYAGDQRGNIWKFDVSSDVPGNWGSPSILFTAKSHDNQQQHITSRLEAGRHPETGILIYFGTGKYIEPSDNTTAIPTQTFYGIWDKLDVTQTLVQRSELLEQSIDANLTDGHRTSSANEINWAEGAGQHKGWFIDLPTAGERQVSRSLLRSGRIIFTTLIPDTEPCSFGGDSWLLELDAISGGRLSKSPFDLNGDKEFDEDDLVTLAATGEDAAISGIKSSEGILPTPTILHSGSFDLKFGSGTKGGIFKVVEEPGPQARSRVAWQQLQ